MIQNYIPIFDTECSRCEHTPIVGLLDEGKVRSTSLCGPHFFNDRSMVDWNSWNDNQEDSE